MGLFDLEEQFAFYGAYHNNKINFVIHVLFVWPIFFTAILLWAFSEPLMPFPLPSQLLPFQQYMVLNWSFVFAGVYALYYTALDKKAGSLAAALCLACWVGSNALAHQLGFSLGWKVVLATQLLCWTSQFIGHGVFEGRAPALFDNLAQALLMAPFFVLLEVLHLLFGYEPYPGFMSKVRNKVAKKITKFKKQT